jgi:hypothetical protein
MNELYKKVADFNSAMNAVSNAVKKQTTGALYLRDILAKKIVAKASEKEVFDTFSEANEQEAAESKGNQSVPSFKTVAEAVEANSSLSKTDIFLAKLRAKAELAKETELSPEASLEAEGEPLAETVISVYEDEILDDEGLASAIAEEVKTKETSTESFSLNIVLNDKQIAGREMAFAGKSFCFIGPAGTGKTTGQRAVAEALLEDGKLSTSTFKTYDKDGARKYVSAPSIAFCAYTRRAASNLRKAIHKSPILADALEHNIMTVHALLEFEPVTYEDYNEEGKLVTKFRFEPMRTAQNPLNITHLIIEEASMLDAYTLWKQLYDALPQGVQIIFIGDINQLPPVFGPSILNYALVQLPIVELTEVYRNQGVVLENAHNILAGKSLVEDNNFVVVRGRSQVQQGQATIAKALGELFNTWMDVKGSDGLPEYDPNDCIILSPFNKQPLGTVNLNAWISQHLGARRKAVVHEVIAGFSKVYLAIGDRVMVNKMDGAIVDIYRNPSYHGKEPQIAGRDLTRFGVRILGEQEDIDLDELSLDYSTFSLEALEAEKAERKQQASHTVVVELENGKTEELTSAGDFGEQSFSLGYALTVHKAQGSEWRKVFIILHKEHAVSLYRELFYTAVTRARTKVTIIAKDAVIEKAIKNQRIKGNTIKDKLEYFNSGVNTSMEREPVYAYK